MCSLYCRSRWLLAINDVKQATLLTLLPFFTKNIIFVTFIRYKSFCYDKD